LLVADAEATIMTDFTQYNMALWGAVSALVTFAIFIGTWWWYGMRVHEARALVRTGAALLVDVDEPKEFAAHPVDGARNIPLASLADEAVTLGSHRRPIVVCGQSALATMSAARRLRGMGYRVIDAGPMNGI
jgi:rhodanese-related sulfurtransferase